MIFIRMEAYSNYLANLKVTSIFIKSILDDHVQDANSSKDNWKVLNSATEFHTDYFGCLE